MIQTLLFNKILNKKLLVILNYLIEVSNYTNFAGILIFSIHNQYILICGWLGILLFYLAGRTMILYTKSNQFHFPLNSYEQKSFMKIILGSCLMQHFITGFNTKTLKLIWNEDLNG